MTASKVALVTGGSAGIGESVCRHFLEAGYLVINLSRRPSATAHERLIDLSVDLSDIEATRAVMNDLVNDHQITTLVHNAGVIRPALLEEVEIEDVGYLHRLHIEAAVVMTQATLPAMKSAGFGRIIVIGSRAMVGLQTRTAYSATKAGQAALVRTWALELGQHGITVNCVAPGPVITDMFTEVMPEDSERARKLAHSLPVQRLGRPDDVARAVKFLADADNGFITGQTLFVCGGSSIGNITI